MRAIRNRIVAMLMTLALVVTLLPQFPLTSNAANSPYFQFNDYSTDINSPTEVNSNIVDIAGTFANISSSTITYKIEKLTRKATSSTPDGSLTDNDFTVAESSVSSSRPIISGNNAYMFSAVTVYDGLNRITISGANTSGNTVSGEAYVNFTNVPVISEVKLINGTALPEGSSVVTTNPTETITLKAPNATEVTINGTQMIGGSGSTFVLSGIVLNHGLNKLTIVAHNPTRTYELTRYLVYYNGSLTAYNVKLGTNSLDGDPTFSAAITGAAVTGSVVLPFSGTTAPTAPSFTVEMWQKSKLDAFIAGTTPTPAPDATATVAGTLSQTLTGYAVYNISTNGVFNLASNGDYILRITNPDIQSTEQLPFSYLSANSPYITSVKQAYNVTQGTTTINYTSSANFSDGSTLTKLPIWLVLDTQNFDASDAAYSSSLEIHQNSPTGPDVTSSAVIQASQTTDKKPAFLITSLPAGQLSLVFTVKKGTTASYSVTRNITYYPAPAIQIDNVYSGQLFDVPADFSGKSIVGKLLNFNLNNAAEVASLKVSMNGVTADLDQVKGALGVTPNISTDTGKFTFDPAKAGLELVAGANTLVFSGTANGIPVSTTLTLYYLSKDQPAVSSIQPVPYVLPPLSDLDPDHPLRQFKDGDVKFSPTDTNEFTTTEKTLDLLFDAMDFDFMEVQVNGETVATGTVDTNGILKTTNNLFVENHVSKLATQSSPLSTGETAFHLRLSNVVLPQSGSTNFTIVLHKGTATVSQNVTIIRDLSPYIILSPKLPDEAVINANFLNISIKAEGASQVLIGKVAMTKGEGDIFRYDMEGLKSGKNTIKFTVVQGSTKLNGSFVVTYAADDSIGAQYKAPIGKSGKISIFSGDLALTFPKNTYLRQANGTPGQDVKTTDLFDGQNLYFGIADRTDGRTVKKYNQVGETDSSGNYLDGTIKDVPADSYSQDRLVPKLNFSYSSNLYWIDAGYFDSTTSSTTGDYTMVNAMLPYQTGNNNMFYARAYYPEKWLEPSQRGTITIKYDPSIADVYAKNLSVWRYTSNGWTNVGGVVNTKNKTVAAPFDGFGYYAVMGLRYSFSDIIGHKYARTALEAMLAHGIMNNKDQNSFGVYENITRGEFAEMIVKIMGVPLSYDVNNMTFDDVQPYDYPDQPYWNYRYVETAVKMGYIRGKSPRLFFPNDPLTRAEAAVIISRALNLVKSNADMDKDLKSLQKVFTDASTTDPYAVSSILAINKAGYITGVPNTVAAGNKATYRFEPDSFLSRADAAVIAQRIMVKLKKL